MKEKIRRLTVMGVMAAISIVLVFFIHFPIFPQAPFLEYDPADIPILITALAYGPLDGMSVAVTAAVIQGLTVSAQSGPYGIMMHIISTCSLALTAGFIYRARRDMTGAVAGLSGGVLVSAAIMAGANLIITPLFMGAPVEAVKAMLLPVILPFNLIKGGINAAVTVMAYKPVSVALRSMTGEPHGDSAKPKTAVLLSALAVIAVCAAAVYFINRA